MLRVLLGWTCSGGSVVQLRRELGRGWLVRGCRLVLGGQRGLHLAVRICGKCFYHASGPLGVWLPSPLVVVACGLCLATVVVGGLGSVLHELQWRGTVGLRRGWVQAYAYPIKSLPLPPYF